MKNDTPIYVEAIREAKRRTKRGSAERKILEDMDHRTRPPQKINIVEGAITAQRVTCGSL